ncbi:MAG: hypothetical protein QOE63_1391 [Acidimicrobiaceae bacterium]|jgi:hypothetical protein
MPFVPDDLDVPTDLDGGWCRLRPLAVSDNDRDFAAWHGSVEHIAATPGYAGRDWPTHDYTLEQNEADLAEHEADFAARRGFTYTVIDGVTDDVIGCVYLYPPRDEDGDADGWARSWVRADFAERDADLYHLVSDWLEATWPFERVAYAPRP